MDVHVQLNKSSYFPGETVRCYVRVAHARDDPIVVSEVEQITVVADCTGTERTDPGWLGQLYRPATGGTKEGKRLVRPIFTSARAVLLRAASEPAGYQRGFLLRYKLPTRIPPTYKGSAIRFQYQVAVRASCSIAGVARTGQAVAPFAVWPSGAAVAASGVNARRSSFGAGPADAAGTQEVAVLGDGSAGPPLLPAAANGGAPAPLEQQESIELDPSGAAASGPSRQEQQQPGGEGGRGDMEHVEGALASRQLSPLQQASMVGRAFNLRAGDHPLCRITLQPPLASLLVPGGTLSVLLDFGAAHGPAADPSVQPICSQVTVMLESEEVVHAPHGHGKAGDATMRKLHCEQAEVTEHLLACSFVFSIPPNACPSFRTPMVSHQWLLRFELALVVPRPGGRGVATEQLVWTLPGLVVWPPIA